MTFEEQLVRYLDGGTSAIEDEELMAQMAVSPEKRGMLRAHLRMREAMHRDAASLRPTRTQRAAAVAMLLATAGAEARLAAPRSSVARTGLSRIALAAASAAVGAVATYVLTTQAINPSAAPSTVILSPNAAPVIQSTAPQDAPIHEPPTRVEYERVVVPETVQVASPPVILRDTVFVQVPAARMISVPPTVTIQRETVYVAPKQ